MSPQHEVYLLFLLNLTHDFRCIHSNYRLVLTLTHTPPVEVEEAFWELQCFSLRCKEVCVKFSVHVSKSEQKSAPVMNYGFYMKIRLAGFGKKKIISKLLFFNRPPSRENTLPRRTPPTQHKYTTTDAYQTLPKNLHQSPPAGRQGEYKYAQDRLSHFRIPPGVGGQASKTVWELYEWHQRQLFRHASPTAPLYTPAPEYPFGPGSLSAVPTSFPASRSDGSPRCVSVPPSSADIPPPGPPPGLSHTLSPNRRPHTPADRVTVRPMGDTSPDVPFTVSPRRSKSQLFKVKYHLMPDSITVIHSCPLNSSKPVHLVFL